MLIKYVSLSSFTISSNTLLSHMCVVYIVFVQLQPNAIKSIKLKLKLIPVECRRKFQVIIKFDKSQIMNIIFLWKMLFLRNFNGLIPCSSVRVRFYLILLASPSKERPHMPYFLWINILFLSAPWNIDAGWLNCNLDF